MEAIYNAYENFLSNHPVLTLIIICIILYIVYIFSIWISDQETLSKTGDASAFYMKLHKICHPIYTKKKEKENLENMLELTHIEYILKTKYNIFVTYELELKDRENMDWDDYCVTLYNINTHEVVYSVEVMRQSILPMLTKILNTYESSKGR